MLHVQLEFFVSHCDVLLEFSNNVVDSIGASKDGTRLNQRQDLFPNGTTSATVQEAHLHGQFR